MTHYDTLNIDKDATEADIKRAYKKLALKHHPDRGGDKEKFQEIQKAYDILVDHNAREDYNNEISGNKHSIFDMLFNQHSGLHRRQQPKGSDVNFELSIDLEQAFTGVVKKIKITRKVLCSKCDGNGTPLEENKRVCQDCDGTGAVSHLRHMGIMQMVQRHPCQKCSQRGYIIPKEHLCTSCSGCGTTPQSQQIDIPVKRACRNGQIIVFEGMADEQPGTIPGDLLVHIKIRPHHIYTRKGDDLYMTKELKLHEALGGYEFVLKQLDGSNIRIQHTGTTQPETTTPIDNKGMPILNSTNRGKLWIKIKVVIPENISDDIIKSLKILQE